MQALILAAGKSSRLGLNRPKCLAEVGERALIEHQLDALRAVGVRRVTVVVGFGADLVRAAVRGRATCIENEQYATTNSLYSFMLAGDHLDDDLLVLNCDVLVHPGVTARLARSQGSALAYDSRSGADVEHMKVEVLDGGLLQMSKSLPAPRVCGENVGMIRLDRDAARATFAASRELVADGRGSEWLATAITRTAASHRLECQDVGDLPWVEIDFPEDLARARDVVYPAIDRRVATRPVPRLAPVFGDPAAADAAA